MKKWVAIGGYVAGAVSLCTMAGLGYVFWRFVYLPGQVEPLQRYEHALELEQGGHIYEAKIWYKAAARWAQPDALLTLGHVFSDKWSYYKQLPPQTDIAVMYYSAAATLGNAEAMAIMGQLYAKGEKPIQQDNQQALYWFKQAADRGEPFATRALYRAYKDGALGQTVSDTQARYWQQQMVKIPAAKWERLPDWDHERILF